jgi:hypothetical protein
MELSGKIIEVLDVVSGEGKNGTWKKQDYVIETVNSKYPKKVAFTVWGDKIDKFNIQLDSDVIASIEIESREYNGKWYTNVQAWDVKIDDTAAHGQPSMPDMPEFDGDDTDDLPF